MERITAELLIPGSGHPVRDGVVVLDGAQIGYAGPASGAPDTPAAVAYRAVTVMPGLWDCHGHFLGSRTFDLGQLPLEPVALRAPGTPGWPRIRRSPPSARRPSGLHHHDHPSRTGNGTSPQQQKSDLYGDDVKGIWGIYGKSYAPYRGADRTMRTAKLRYPARSNAAAIGRLARSVSAWIHRAPAAASRWVISASRSST
jgi:hypothetical protein